VTLVTLTRLNSAEAALLNHEVHTEAIPSATALCEGFPLRYLGLVILLSALNPWHALGQRARACDDLDTETRAKIIRNIARSAHTEPLLPVIEEETLVPGTCYRRLSLSVASSTVRLTLYLSPDRRFVFSNLTDVSVDPWIEESQRSKQLAQQAEKDQAPTRGPGTAPVMMVVFSDLQCPYCAAFSETVERYRKANPDRIRVVFRNLPLSVHEWAAPAARAGICIFQQSPASFWKFHDSVLSKQRAITANNLPATIADFLASAPELNKEAYSKCMASNLPQQNLDQDLAEAMSLKIDATPTIFINGRKYTGFRDDAAFALAINLATQAESSQRGILHEQE